MTKKKKKDLQGKAGKEMGEGMPAGKKGGGLGGSEGQKEYGDGNGGEEKQYDADGNEGGLEDAKNIVREPAAVYNMPGRMTVEEFLKWEDGQQQRHEYYQSQVFAMAGSKLPHVRITDNLVYRMNARLDGGPCQTFSSDLRLYIKAHDAFVYPDLTVVCGEPETLNGDDWNLLNPGVLFEVLSPSTRSYDQGQKFMMYSDVPSLLEYVLVDSVSMKIDIWRRAEKGDLTEVKELYARTEDSWKCEKIEGPDGMLVLQSLGLTIPLREIYAGAKLG